MSPGPRVVELTFPAQARYLVLARLSLAGVAEAARLDAESLADLKLAITEACSNAVQHAYADGDGDVRVRIELGDDRLAVEVADRGSGFDAASLPSWRPSALRESGMGLSIIRSVTDGLEIASAGDGAGTTLRFVKTLASS